MTCITSEVIGEQHSKSLRRSDFSPLKTYNKVIFSLSPAVKLQTRGTE